MRRPESTSLLSRLGPTIATVALISCASALAWPDPGVLEGYSPTPSVASTLEEEMRDLRRAHMRQQRERAASSRQEFAALALERETRDLRAEFRAWQRAAARTNQPGESAESLAE